MVRDAAIGYAAARTSEETSDVRRRVTLTDDVESGG